MKSTVHHKFFPRLLPVSCGGIFLASALSMDAASIATSYYESFGYETGDVAGESGGDGFSGSWSSVQAGGAGNVTTGSLTYPGPTYPSSAANKLTVAGGATGNQAALRLLGTTLDSGTFYFSYLTSKDNATSRSLNFAFFGGSETNPTNERFAIGQIGSGTTNTNGNLVLLPLNTPASIVNATTPIAYGVGVTHLVVGKVEFNVSGTNDRITLWVDPDPNALETEPATPYLTSAGFNINDVTAIRPFAGNTSGSFSAVTGNFDEIRLGETWASVVPEPGSAALALLGAATLLGRRRR